MAKYLLKTCCACGSLRTGTLFSGIAAILLSIIGIIVILVADINIKTLVFDWLDKWIVELIIILNFVMTVILSTIMIVGVIKRNWFMMIPWIVLGGMLAVGLLVSIIMNAVSYYVTYGDVLVGTLWLVLGLVALVIYCYMWYVSFSFFANLKEEWGKGAYSKDPFRRQRI